MNESLKKCPPFFKRKKKIYTILNGYYNEMEFWKQHIVLCLLLNAIYMLKYLQVTSDVKYSNKRVRDCDKAAKRYASQTFRNLSNIRLKLQNIKCTNAQIKPLIIIS